MFYFLSTCFYQVGFEYATVNSRLYDRLQPANIAAGTKLPEDFSAVLSWGRLSG